MAQQRLRDLRRQLPAACRFGIDAPASEEVPQRMRPVFGLAVPVDDASAKHGVFDPKIKVFVILDRADLRREYEVNLADWAGEFPLSQFRNQLRTNRHRAAAAIALGRPYNIPLVGTLAHVKLTRF